MMKKQNRRKVTAIFIVTILVVILIFIVMIYIRSGALLLSINIRYVIINVVMKQVVMNCKKQRMIMKMSLGDQVFIFMGTNIW